MAILFVHDASNDDIGVYDTVIQQLEAAGQGQPTGRLSHVAARKGTGYLVVDVWESQEDLDRFAQILMPLLQQAGSKIAEPQIYPIHNRITPA